VSALANLEPQLLWNHFERLAAIPRASRKEAAAREYIRGIAASSSLETVEDPAGNLIVRKPGRPGRDFAPMALLQGHLDMVCEKNEGTVHDFDADPIKLLHDGDWLKADGTTLGADNGVGVAAALAVLESKDISHGPLEFVFTIDEETGLTGAAQFQPGLLKSKYFLNLDTEEEGQLCIGCAGGINTIARRKVKLIPAGAGTAWRIKVSGLRGGHSGVDIHQGRGNAVQILGSILQDLLERVPLKFSSINGGSAHNAIPREAAAVIVIEPSHETELKSLVAAGEAAHKCYLGAFDPGLEISVEQAGLPTTALDAKDTENTVALLTTLPFGVLAMSPDVPGLDESCHREDERRCGGNHYQPAKLACRRQNGRRSHGGDERTLGWLRGGEQQQLPRMETGTGQRPGAQASGSTPKSFRPSGQSYCHARGPGVRCHRRKISRDAVDLLRPYNRGSSQPARTRENLVGRAFLDVPEECSRIPLAPGASVNNLAFCPVSMLHREPIRLPILLRLLLSALRFRTGLNGCPGSAFWTAFRSPA